MTRVIPPLNTRSTSNMPKWLDIKAVAAAAAPEQELRKQAIAKTSAVDTKAVVASYACPACSKVFQASHPELIRQTNLRKVSRVDSMEEELEMLWQQSPEGGNQDGIPFGTAASNLLSSTYGINGPELEQVLTQFRAQKPQGTATPPEGRGGKYNFYTPAALNCPSCGEKLAAYQSVPKVTSVNETRDGAMFAFSKDLQKTASGTYNTFTDRHLAFKAVDKLSDYAMKQGMTQARARYLIAEHTKMAGQEYPTLNSVECSIEWRFGKNQKHNVTAKIEVQPDGNFKMPKVFKTADGSIVPFEKESIQAIEKAADYDHQKKLQQRKSDNPIYKRQDPSNFRATASAAGATSDVLAADLASEVIKKKSVASPQPGVQNAPPPAAPPAGGPAMTFQPGQEVVNPSDGKTYKVQTVTPGQGAQVIDSMTNQPAAIPENQMQGLKPAVTTTSQAEPTLRKMASFNDIVAQLIEEQKPALVTTEQRLAAQISLRPRIAHVRTMAARWNEVRRELLDKQAAAKQAALPPTDETGHSKVNNVPFAEKKDVTLGLTEFPKGQDKKDSVGVQSGKGYDIPFKKMNENQVKEREHFDNEKRMPQYREKREESIDYKYSMPEKNLGLNLEPDKNMGTSKDLFETAALRQAIGLPKYSIELAVDDPPEDEIKKKPLEYRNIQKAPPIPEYKEPGMIPEASGRIKEAVTKWKKVQQEIAASQAKMLEILKPLQQQIQDASKPHSETLKAKQEELKKYFEMAYSALKETNERVAAYESSIMAAVEREVPTGAPAKLEEVLKLAETKAPEILKKLTELKALIEGQRASTVLEQLLYEYPVSKIQEPKIRRTSLETTADHDVAHGFIEMLKRWVEEIHVLNSELGEPAPAGA